jgi:flagellar protein FlaF
MQSYALAAYDSAVREVLSGRELEGTVLRKSALRLRACQENPGDVLEMMEALRLNQAIWSVFQSELLEPTNALPQALRANLLRLSLVVDRETLEAQRTTSAEALDLLIDINLAIAEGLFGGTPGLCMVSRPDDSQQVVHAYF